VAVEIARLPGQPLGDARAPPDAVSAAMARRTVWRLTAKRLASAISPGSFSPRASLPPTMSSRMVSAMRRHMAMPPNSFSSSPSEIVIANSSRARMSGLNA
jgi:hypothetical protein